MKRIVFFSIVLVALTFANVSATIINIPDDYPTIQDGINVASNGDTVLVHSGIYIEHIDFLGKGILVTGQEGPDYTIIESQTGGIPIVSFISGETSAAILSGFTVRQQYIDYSIKLPYKYRFQLTGGPVIIPTEPILDVVLLQACPCYRAWADDPGARCEVTSSFRSPDYNTQEGGVDSSLHQYGLAIDIGYGDYRTPGKKDASRAVWQCVLDLGYEQIFPSEHPEMSYNHVHVQNFRYRTMPYVER